MCEIVKVKSDAIFEMVKDMLEMDKSAKITVVGDSMFPFLRNGIDSVELSQSNFVDIGRGDIVMIKRTTGQYVMHRVIKKELDCFFMVGDAQQWIEGPLLPEQLVAVVKTVWRRDKRIECAELKWGLPAMVWLKALRVRGVLLRVIRKLSAFRKR